MPPKPQKNIDQVSFQSHNWRYYLDQVLKRNPTIAQAWCEIQNYPSDYQPPMLKKKRTYTPKRKSLKKIFKELVDAVTLGLDPIKREILEEILNFLKFPREANEGIIIYRNANMLPALKLRCKKELKKYGKSFIKSLNAANANANMQPQARMLVNGQPNVNEPRNNLANPQPDPQLQPQEPANIVTFFEERTEVNQQQATQQRIGQHNETEPEWFYTTINMTGEQLEVQEEDPEEDMTTLVANANRQMNEPEFRDQPEEHKEEQVQQDDQNLVVFRGEIVFEEEPRRLLDQEEAEDEEFQGMDDTQEIEYEFDD